MSRHHDTHTTPGATPTRTAKPTAKPPGGSPAGCTFESLEGRQLFATVPSGFVDTKVAGNLSTPTGLDAAPDGRIFIAEQGGTIKLVKNGQLLSTPFATLSNVNSSTEQGLLGIELDPNFAQNKHVYVYYTVNASGTTPSHNRVSRLTANGDTAVPGSEVVIFDMADTESAKWHNGGAMQFGPDGKLYVAVGDMQSGSSAQRLSSLKGKILRINPDGSIPTDNPFYGQTTGLTRAIWALGLRNPYTMAVQPGTGRLYAADVGNQTWEELNDIKRGGNYGWSTVEGDVNDSRFVDPVFAYQHNVSGGGECIIGGAFYTGVAQQFPGEYQDKYFFADFSRSWIKTFDPSTKQVKSFATGARNPTGMIATPDGSIWYITRGAGAGSTAGAIGSLNRITYANSTAQRPAITDQPEPQRVRVGDAATFSVAASGPGTLTYQWYRGNTQILGATAPTYTLASPTLADDNVDFWCAVSNAYGSANSALARLDVVSGNAPVGTITSPVAGSTYGGGQQFSFAGTGTDTEDGTLAAAAFTWWVDFHHDTHSHPFVSPTTGSKTGSFTIPNNGETSADVWYRVHLTVTDADGLTHQTHRDIQPRKATVTLQTNPAGLNVNLDGTPHASGYAVLGVAGVNRLLEAPVSQLVNGVPYEFAGWSDGHASASRTIAFPEQNTTYVANYRPATHVFLSDLPAKGTPINGKGPIERDRANGGSTAGDGTRLTLNGVTYDKGLGVWSKSDVSFDLNKRFKTFLTDIGVDDVVGAGGSVIFKVYLDGTKVYDSGIRTGSSNTRSLNIDVTGKTTLRLVVENADGSTANDSADWANARLVAVNASATPAKPSTVAATAASSSQINVTWSDGGTFATAYRIERSTDGENFTLAGLATSSARSFSDKGLLPNTAYFYRVIALNGSLQSEPAAAAATTPAGPLTLQAENASLSGAVVLSDKTGFTGSGFVDYTADAGGAIQWSFNVAEAGTYPLAFRYALKEGTRPLKLTVNGVDVATPSFTSTTSWSIWKTLTANAALTAGQNVVRLSTTGANGPNVDSVTVGARTGSTTTPTPVTYQAETALRQGAEVENTKAGFTGSGYIDFVLNAGEWIEWTVNAPTAGTYTLGFRYALEKLETRSLRLDVNGVQAAGALAFTSTGSWTTWRTLTAQTTLQAGQNTVRITTTGSMGPNIDSLTVS